MIRFIIFIIPAITVLVTKAQIQAKKAITTTKALTTTTKDKATAYTTTLKGSIQEARTAAIAARQEILNQHTTTPTTNN